jgi:hypothetical protein
MFSMWIISRQIQRAHEMDGSVFPYRLQHLLSATGLECGFREWSRPLRREPRTRAPTSFTSTWRQSALTKNTSTPVVMYQRTMLSFHAETVHKTVALNRNEHTFYHTMGIIRLLPSEQKAAISPATVNRDNDENRRNWTAKGTGLVSSGQTSRLHGTQSG